jgi:hypothetical protein
VFVLIWYLMMKRERRAINVSSFASNPVQLRLSDSRLRRMCPNLYPTTGLSGFFRCFFFDGLGTREYIRDMLVHGDSRAAVVISTDPLLVASYCDDSDAVCVLGFEPNEVGGRQFEVGDRLLTVLISFVVEGSAQPGDIAADLIQGHGAKPNYVNFWPLIADFLSDDAADIEQRKANIAASEYARCQSFGEVHLRRLPGQVRDGRPDRSRYPARASGSAR